MRAHSSQRRPTQAHEEENGPNDARRIVWAGIGKFFLMYFFLMYNLSTKAQRRPMQAHKERKRFKRCVWRRSGHRPIGMFFLIMYFFKNLQLIHAGTQRWKESP